MFFKCLAWLSVRQVAGHNTLKAADVSWVLFWWDPEIIPSSVMELGNANQQKRILECICIYFFQTKMQHIKCTEVYMHMYKFHLSLNNYHWMFTIFKVQRRNTAKSPAFWALNSSSSSSAALRHKSAWNCRTLRFGFLGDFQCWYLPTKQCKLEIISPQVISLLIWSHHPRPCEKPWSPNFLLLGPKGSDSDSLFKTVSERFREVLFSPLHQPPKMGVFWKGRTCTSCS